ncbi:MAG: cobalamin B12-binding domain-containing protein [Alphaproteobacteria bacterium]|nr:cobalamin B12-binding domain-containing protein [Alphaproteobacteria bacterium]
MQKSPVVYEEFDHGAFMEATRFFSSASDRLPHDSVRAIAEEVVNVLVRRASAPRKAGGVPLLSARIDALCDALVGDDPDAAANMILQERLTGVPIDIVYLGYIGQAATQLGTRWDDDEISLFDMTVAAGRMFGILRGLRGDFTPSLAKPEKRALFATAPGEEHAIGITMAADMFSRRSWDIDLEVGLSHDQILEVVDNTDYPIVGLSAGSEDKIVALSRLIVALRISKPWLLILVSGQLADTQRDLMQIVGADGIAFDAASAITEMDRFSELLLERWAPTSDM